MWLQKQRGLVDVRDEVGDVQIVLWSICSILGIDSVECAYEKFEKVKQKQAKLS